MERIYQVLKGEELQAWLSIAIIRSEDGTATVETRSTHHVVKARLVSFTWGKEFSDADILNDADLLRVVYERYGREIFTIQTHRDF